MIKCVQIWSLPVFQCFSGIQPEMGIIPKVMPKNSQGAACHQTLLALCVFYGAGDGDVSYAITHSWELKIARFFT